MRRFLALALLALLAPAALPPAAHAAHAAQASARALTFDDLFEKEHVGRRPEQLAWRPDGAALTYLWDAGDGEALWSLDPATNKAKRLFTVSDLEGLGGSLDAYHGFPTGTAEILESGGDLFLWRPGAGLERLTKTEADEEAPTLSPDGTKLAYVRQGNLYLLDLSVPAARRTERALTTDGEPGKILNGTNDWVYGEEIWNRSPEGFWWSPDSRRIAYYHFDDTPVGRYTLLPDYTPPYPEPRYQSYPKAGTANPKVRFGVLDLATGKTAWLHTESREETYLARLRWLAKGDRVAVERLNREQTDLDLLLCSPTTGACGVALRETHSTWVNLGTETTFLPGGRFLWASARDGWRHLYLYSLGAGAEAKATLVRQLTSGAWAVAGVQTAGDDALVVTAYGTGPLGAAYRRLLWVPLDGSPMREIAAGHGWHQADVAPGGRYLVHAWSSADDPGWQRVESLGQGGALERTADLPSTPPAFDPAALPQWRFFQIPAGDGAPAGTLLPAAELLPEGVASDGGDSDGAPGEARHPVIMYHYGGPGSQVVSDRWATRGRGLWHKMMAQRGFGVLYVDNLASVFFGKAGEDRVHRRFGEVNLAAQKAGVEYLKTRPWADPGRIGLWGWSGGGSNTLYCVLNSPGTWHAAVAGAPVTNWRYYDTIWTERYLDSPQDNPDGYDASSPISYADQLADALLIVHGTADDNVHPQNTMAMADAWVKADIPFEMAIYPGEKHGFREPANRHFYERMTEFFERKLSASR